MKKLLFLALFISPAIADCEFRITNYSRLPVTFKAGFYNESSITKIAIPKTVTTSVLIRSAYQCTSASASGTGLAYIQLINDPYLAGLNYNPNTNSAVLMGKFTGDSSGRIALSDEGGKPVWLSIGGNPVEDGYLWLKINVLQIIPPKLSITP